MKFRLSGSVRGVLVLATLAVASRGQSQAPDSIARDSIVDVPVAAGPPRDRGALRLTSGHTYNRVEGLPVLIGPVLETHIGSVRINTRVLGIIRSAETFRWDSENIGHDAGISAAFPGSRKPTLELRAYDVVEPVEDWQLPAGEAGLAAFFFHSDFRDYFGRHGVSLSGSVAASRRATVGASFASERWLSRRDRDAITVFRNNQPWRPNPSMDEGKFRIFGASLDYDSRNDLRFPSTGWLASVRYEFGSGVVDLFGGANTVARKAADPATRYGRAMIDVRRYMRLAPQTELHARFFVGGWLHGDELPLQRRLSVGGPATIPGTDFRRTASGPDVGQCSTVVAPAGDPAQCERAALLQLEYRTGLQALPGTIFDGNPIRLRIRSRALTLRPALVAFADLGRGWLLPPRSNDRQVGTTGIDVPAPQLVYGANGLPPLATFRADVGLGVDLGLFGVYIAKSVSEPKDAANIFLRARRRF